jgi:hypothetical protein
MYRQRNPARVPELREKDAALIAAFDSKVDVRTGAAPDSCYIAVNNEVHNYHISR